MISFSLLEDDKNDKIKSWMVLYQKIAESKKKILSNCKAKLALRFLEQMTALFETRCVVEAYIGKQKKFRKVYSS